MTPCQARLLLKAQHMTQFEKIRSHAIPALQATVEDYIAPASGARHIHLGTTGADMAFLVAFPTVPDASDGRAHILEHLVLCGSRRYPVRDPFFSMMRRSTATFMNAFTYADRTVYPFCSTNEQDFSNLLDVYLDAVFFPSLDYLNFLQEGWRYTLKDGKLGYQGVVFNEMKGAFTASGHALYRGIVSTLLRGTTYEVESGGDPLAIPGLTHRMLSDFHASHYHPSQAVFMTAGPMSAAAMQRQIADRVLGRIPGAFPRRLPQLAQRPVAPLRNTVRVPSHASRSNEFGMQLTWLMGESANLKAAFDARLLLAGLLGNAAAPLRKAMESAGYGRPSRLNGYDDSARQMLFHFGMEGLAEAQVDAAEALIRDTLEQVARTGVPVSTLRALLRDLKYRQRDTSSRGMPNVLQRLVGALPVAMRDGDIIGALDTDGVLQTLEHDIADPAYFKGMVQAVVASPAQLVSKIVPDAAYFATRDAMEQDRLAEHEAALSEAERERIDTQTAALEAHQQRPFDDAVLPRIKPGDVRPWARAVHAIDPAADGVHAFSIASNGISSASVVYDVSDFPRDDWQWLTLYADLLADLGIGHYSYEEAGAWRQRMVPSFEATLQAVQLPSGALQLDLAYSASGLREEHASLATVLTSYILRPRFDEHIRLGYLIERMVQDELGALAEAGSHYAVLAASAPLSRVRGFSDRTSGAAALPFHAFVKRLAATPDGLATIAAELARIHAALLARRSSILCAGSGNDAELLARMLAAALPRSASAAPPPAFEPAMGADMAPANVALYAASQVNHCSIAWPVPQMHHDDAAALAVAAQLLTSQVLHPALREIGGAYGGHADYAGDVGVFSMASYRDPRLAGTYADFTAALDQLLLTDYPVNQVEEAIIGVIKGLDRPVSPPGEVYMAWNLHRRGIGQQARQTFRDRVLGCTQVALKEAVRKWLKGGAASRAAFAANTTQDLAGLDVVDLMCLAV